MLDVEGFQQQQVDKEKAELFNAHRDNCDQEINLIMKQFIAHRRHSFEDLTTEVLIHLKLKVKESLKAIDTRLQKIHLGGI
nr:MADS-box transcription factor 57 [Brachypodium distachyon]